MAYVGEGHPTRKSKAAMERKFPTGIKKENGNKFWEEGKYLVPEGYEKKDIPEKKECCPFELVQDLSQEIPRWSQYGY